MREGCQKVEFDSRTFDLDISDVTSDILKNMRITLKATQTFPLIMTILLGDAKPGTKSGIWVSSLTSKFLFILRMLRFRDL